MFAGSKIFYQRDAVLAWYLLSLRVCPSVCSSIRQTVCHKPAYCIKTAKQRRTMFRGTLKFYYEKDLSDIPIRSPRYGRRMQIEGGGVRMAFAIATSSVLKSTVCSNFVQLMKSVQTGRTPLSTVPTDAKYSLNNSALVLSSVTMLPSLSSRAPIPDR